MGILHAVFVLLFVFANVFNFSLCLSSKKLLWFSGSLPPLKAQRMEILHAVFVSLFVFANFFEFSLSLSLSFARRSFSATGGSTNEIMGWKATPSCCNCTAFSNFQPILQRKCPLVSLIFDIFGDPHRIVHEVVFLFFE